MRMASLLFLTPIALWRYLITSLLLLYVAPLLHHQGDRTLHSYSYVSAQPAGCVISRNITVGVMLSRSGLYAIYGNSALVVTQMYQNWINQKCGVGNIGIGLNLVTIDVASDPIKTINATNYLINTLNASMIVAPEGSLAAVAGQVVASASVGDASKTTVVVGMSKCLLPLAACFALLRLLSQHEWDADACHAFCCQIDPLQFQVAHVLPSSMQQPASAGIRP